MTDVMAGIRASEADRAVRADAADQPTARRSICTAASSASAIPTTFWRELASRSVRIPIAGTPLAVPDQASAALILALHAAAERRRTGVHRPSRSTTWNAACSVFDEPIWRAALELARQVGAEAAFTAGLSLADAGSGAAGPARGAAARRPDGVAGARPRPSGAVTPGSASSPASRTGPRGVVAVRDAVVPSPAQAPEVLSRSPRRHGGAGSRVPAPLVAGAARGPARRAALAPRAAGGRTAAASRRPGRDGSCTPALRLITGGDRTRAATLAVDAVRAAGGPRPAAHAWPRRR